MPALGVACLSIDWCINPSFARQMAGNNITIQGNFDPAKTYCSNTCNHKRGNRNVVGIWSKKIFSKFGSRYLTTRSCRLYKGICG